MGLITINILRMKTFLFFLSPQNSVYQRFVVKANSAVILRNLTQLLIINISVCHQCKKRDSVAEPVVAF